jgi:hypothetical protein
VRHDAEVYVKAHKVDRRNQGLLQPLQISYRAWDSVGMDFITQLLKMQIGHHVILLFVNRLTKMAHFVLTGTEVSSDGSIKLFLRFVWRLHGFTKGLVMDWGSQWTAKFTCGVMHMVRTKPSITMA